MLGETSRLNIVRRLLVIILPFYALKRGIQNPCFLLAQQKLHCYLDFAILA